MSREQLGSIPASLRFDDWLHEEMDARSEYLTIANSTDEDVEGVSRARYATFSAMMKPSAIRDVLKDLSWEVHADIARPRFYSDKGKIVFRLGGETEAEGHRFWPFVLFRWYHDLAPPYYEVTDEFIDYLRLAPEEGHWVQPSTGRVVVRRVSPTHLKVRRDALRDYLAARGLALMRFHDHLRWSCASTTPFRAERDMNGKTSRLQHIVDKEPGGLFRCNDGACWLGMIWGKDAVLPADEPSHPDYLYEKDKLQPEPLPDYIVDDKGGTMKPVAYYGDNASPFLTPVFFKPEVLLRYLNDARAFEVDGHYIRDNAGIWGMPFMRSTTGAVIIWLGDLAQDLPTTEHKFWKPYNIPPSGWLREEFFRSQILGEWAESHDEAVRVRNERSRTNRASASSFGQALFREPSLAQSHQLTTLHVPVTNDSGELTTQIGQLAFVTVDALDVDLLTRLLPDAKLTLDETGHRVGSITLLERALVHKFRVAAARAEEIVKPFRAVQDLRTKLRAHLTTSEVIGQSLKLAGISPGTEPIDIFRQVADGIAKSIADVAELFEQ